MRYDEVNFISLDPNAVYVEFWRRQPSGLGCYWTSGDYITCQSVASFKEDYGWCPQEGTCYEIEAWTVIDDAYWTAVKKIVK